MGQYYKPIILKEDSDEVKSWILAHEYNDGLKLMEHSYLKNDFVGAFESLLLSKPQRVVWGGDYADEEPDGEILYGLCSEETKLTPENLRPQVVQERYIVNHTKKEYIDKSKIVDNDGWKIHPLPLLTCEGNGRGGGDFRGEDANDLIGSWSRDLISVEPMRPDEDFKEIEFDLTEG